MKIIDFHVHLRANDNPELHLNYVRPMGIALTVQLSDVLGSGAQPTQEQIQKINDTTISFVQKYPKEYIGFCFLNPMNDEKFNLDELDRCISGHGFKGLKLEISANATNPQLGHIMKRLLELNRPLLHHSWNTDIVTREPNPGTFQNDPDDIAVLAERFPKNKIIMAHLRGGAYRGIHAIKSHKNVWTDTSGAQPVAGVLEHAVEQLGAHRILFGSDLYGAGGRDPATNIGNITGASITDKEKEMVLRYNAEELLEVKI
ncbi:MAG: amidohydrolase family protein [Elusimicrobiota bacterium]